MECFYSSNLKALFSLKLFSKWPNNLTFQITHGIFVNILNSSEIPLQYIYISTLHQHFTSLWKNTSVLSSPNCFTVVSLFYFII